VSLIVRQAVIDCANARQLSRFWAAALDYDFARDDEGAVVLHDPTGHGLPIELQQVPEAKVVKNRVHLDLLPIGVPWEAEVERLITLGATKQRYVENPPAEAHWCMLDPEGNEFCCLRP